MAMIFVSIAILSLILIFIFIRGYLCHFLFWTTTIAIAGAAHHTCTTNTGSTSALTRVVALSH
jgi:hypothetical protein